MTDKPARGEEGISVAEDVFIAVDTDQWSVDNLALLDWIALIHKPSVPQMSWQSGMILSSLMTFSLHAEGGNMPIASLHTASR